MDKMPCFHSAGTGKGLFGGDERVVYWKCEAGQELQENLTVPYKNEARESALILASRQVGGVCGLQITTGGWGVGTHFERLVLSIIFCIQQTSIIVQGALTVTDSIHSCSKRCDM